MFISIIAALSKNHIIGKKNKLPWKIPKDLEWFKKNTIHKSIIMGRKTWESLKIPLPMRKNIIISKKIKKNDNHKNIIWVNSLTHAIKCASKKKEIMVIGGGSIYSQSIKYANKLYLTHIEKYIEGDTYFPKYNKFEWKTIFFKKYKKINDKEKYSYYFEILERKKLLTYN